MPNKLMSFPRNSAKDCQMNLNPHTRKLANFKTTHSASKRCRIHPYYRDCQKLTSEVARKHKGMITEK